MAKIISDNPTQVNEGELVKTVDEKWKESENQGLEQQHYLNIAYLTGKQWVAYDKTTKKLFEPPKEGWWEERVTINRIRPAVRTELAKVTKAKPQFQGVPKSNEDDDILASQLGTKVIEHIWDNTKMDVKRMRKALWQLSTGTGYLKCFWNPGLGQTIQANTLDENGNFAVDAQGNEITEPKTLGDVENNVVSPFDFRFDPIAEDFEDAHWCIERKLRTVEYVTDTYGVEVAPDDGLLSTNIFNGMLANLNGINSNAPERKIRDGVIVKEYWEKPSKKYPTGRHVTTAGGKLLQYEPNPYDRLPYFAFVHIPVPGRAQGSSIIEDMIPVQREYNKVRTQRRMNQVRTVNPRLAVEDNSLLKDPTGEPGEILRYKRGATHPPSWEQPPGEPGHVQAELELQLRDFEDVGGIHRVSQGAVPTGVKSGIALSILQEQDETTLGPTIAFNEASWTLWGKFVLEIVQEKYIEPRLLKISGKNNSVETIEFKGADLKGNTDIRVIPSSTLPKSDVARKEFILNLWDQKIITDPQTALKLLEFGNIEEIYEDLSIDENQAKAEQKQWLKADFSHKTRDFYNHDIHIKEHNKFRKTDDYEQLDPGTQQTIDQHVQEHQQYLAELTKTEMQMGQGQKGPSEQISFKDLPPAGKVQMASQAGIQLQTQDVIQQIPIQGGMPNGQLGSGETSGTTTNFPSNGQ